MKKNSRNIKSLLQVKSFQKPDPSRINVFQTYISAAISDDFEGFVLDETSLSTIWNENNTPNCEDSIKKKIKILKKNVDEILR